MVGFNDSRKAGWALALVVGVLLVATAAHAARIKDLAQVDGVRDNQLIGFGLVGGLAGTGDDPKNAPYTAEAIANMLASFGFHFEAGQLKVKNFAAVMVNADLPPYLSNGDRLDVTVSSVGSAKSLEGGFLYQTLLSGADGQVYAVAQGPISLGSVVGAGGGAGGGKAHMTTGRVPQGATVERSVPSTVVKPDGSLLLNLRHPDFSTATAVAEAVNTALGVQLARAVDAGQVEVRIPLDQLTNIVPFIALIEGIEVDPGTVARVVINQRTGTVVLGHDVEILPVAVTHGTLTLTFGEKLGPPAMVEVAEELAEEPPLTELQPLPIPGEEAPLGTEGESTPAGTGTQAAPLAGESLMLGRTTAEQVALGLSEMQLSATDIVAIFEAIDAAGALVGKLEVI